ncbi:MAG TPA: hypothetical protein VJS68_04035, partial [Thermoplasmata archaeon]|nr:hypothetical protein [Thermoplasmata archaeon]
MLRELCGGVVQIRDLNRGAVEFESLGQFPRQRGKMCIGHGSPRINFRRYTSFPNGNHGPSPPEAGRPGPPRPRVIYATLLGGREASMAPIDPGQAELAVAAGIAIAGGLIGTGMAQSGIGAAGMGIIAEKPEKFGQVLFFF